MKTCNTCRANKVCDHNKWGFETCGSYIPSDVVEVVRCKDCIHFEAITLDSGISVGFGNCKTQKGINLYPKETDFCSYGTPKERGGEKCI